MYDRSINALAYIAECMDVLSPSAHDVQEDVITHITCYILVLSLVKQSVRG